MKVAVCGLGEIGAVHFDTWSAVEGAEVVAAADPNAGRLEHFAARGAKTYASSEAMIDECGAEVLSIATPPSVHAALSIRALEKGMHVFCEKPMARTLEEGEAMAAAAEKAGRMLGIGYVLRFHDAYRTAREFIQSGRLGRIGTVRTSRCAPPAGDWRKDVAANGGVAFELLTHDLDWLLWSLGPAERVFARGLAKDARTVEREYTLAIVRFESGAIAHLEGSLGEVGEFYASYEIAGTEGMISHDTRNSNVLEVRLMTADGIWASADAPSSERPFARQIKAFAEAVESGGRYEVDAREALGALRAAEAVLSSVQSGRPVEL